MLFMCGYKQHFLKNVSVIVCITRTAILVPSSVSYILEDYLPSWAEVSAECERCIYSLNTLVEVLRATTTSQACVAFKTLLSQSSMTSFWELSRFCLDLSIRSFWWWILIWKKYAASVTKPVEETTTNIYILRKGNLAIVQATEIYLWIYIYQKTSNSQLLCITASDAEPLQPVLWCITASRMVPLQLVWQCHYSQ